MKTTTVLVLLVSTWGLLHGKRDTVLFDRRIASETVDKAYNVFTVCLLWMLGAYFLLLICDGGLHRADYVLFEVVSAFATVGLGVGDYARLERLGQTDSGFDYVCRTYRRADLCFILPSF